MADGLEVERKWLVAMPVPAVVLAAATSSERIDQGYLTIGADGTETRLRRRAGDHVLSVKSGRGLVRAETSIELSAAQFAALWPATATARVQKTRHLIPGPDETTIELDVYGGELDGLVVAEVEFDDAAGAGRFTAPGWFGAEVTDDPRYKNQSLAVRGRPD
jgi:CYTH domain-containing protein